MHSTVLYNIIYNKFNMALLFSILWNILFLLDLIINDYFSK
jgi:hypothetical protein